MKIQAINTICSDTYGIQRFEKKPQRYYSSSREKHEGQKFSIRDKTRRVISKKQHQNPFQFSKQESSKAKRKPRNPTFLREYALVTEPRTRTNFFKPELLSRSASLTKKHKTQLMTKKISYIAKKDKARPYKPKTLDKSQSASHRKGDILEIFKRRNLPPKTDQEYQSGQSIKIYSRTANTNHSLSTKPTAIYKLKTSLKSISMENNSILHYDEPSKLEKKSESIPNKELVPKQIVEQPESHLLSCSSARGSQASYNKKLKSFQFLPLESTKKRSKNPSLINALKQKGSSINASIELEGYLVIQTALEQITLLAKYAQQIIQNYEDATEWDEVIFLSYKKYYLERKKLVRALLFHDSKHFKKYIKNSMVQKKLEVFMRNYECQKLIEELVFENLTVEESLRAFYNLIIQKSGGYINLNELDNFTMHIFRLIFEQIWSLKEVYDHDKEQVTNRLDTVLKCACALADLDDLEFAGRLKSLNQRMGQIKLMSFGNLFDKISKFFQDQICN